MSCEPLDQLIIEVDQFETLAIENFVQISPDALADLIGVLDGPSFDETTFDGE